MSAERIDFVDVLPVVSLRTGLAFVKGDPVGAKQIALAAENIFSYAAGQFLPDEIRAMQLATAEGPVSTEEAIQAFENVLDDSGLAKASPFDWRTILKTLLPFLLGLL